MGEKPALLLHVCCGPCATAVLERLADSFDVTAFWSNPNIQPQEEHDLRLANLRLVTDRAGVDLIVADRDEDDWLEAVEGYEDEPEGGRRCGVCFDYRLQRAAREASRLGIEHMATTLTVSPHKPAQRIHPIGRRVAAEHGLQFLEEDFKKQGGFQRSIELSKQLGLYRQRYCGCLFSRDPEP